MTIKILLADKSITIQKVVEMLFSGREYEVSCASDGETALNEAGRIKPDVVLADIDLPRINGYSFAARLRQEPGLAQTPVILMLSRDDVFDDAKATQAGILDSITKPFESQELIGKVKSAIAAAPQHQAEPAARPTPPRTAGPASPSAPKLPPSKQTAPSDIFDIIQDAPSPADLKPAPFGGQEAVFDAEPQFDTEEQPVLAGAQALPFGDKAVEEMRAGLDLTDEAEQAESDIPGVDLLGLAAVSALDTYVQPPPRRPEPAPREEKEAREYVPPPASEEPTPPAPSFAVSEDMLRGIASETISRMAQEYFNNMPPVQPPQVPEETLRRMVEETVAKTVREIAREVVEKVAWEVIPDMAEMLIRAEIERLKAEP